ncbi:HNH endonuclease [Actinomadura sp. SCN-SB]|uniref:HNH endonuclease n=1 Tax=Actinomadura sp. SCN-SB TaxID=3373092 RepID=UPI0037532AED
MPYASKPSGPWRRTPLPPQWPRLRRAVLERDGHTCRIQGPRCQGRATEVDHIQPGDNHDPNNLQAVCTPCHATKTGKENAARLNASRPRRRREPEPHPGILRPGEK